MGLQLDYFNKIVQITSPTVNVTAQELHDFIENEMASPLGLNYPDDGTYDDWAGIIRPEGKIDVDPTNPGTIFSQIILVLHPLWQIQFWGGSGITRIRGGTIVGGVGNNPVKASGTANDITYFQSPVDGVVVVQSGGGSITEQDKLDIADRVWDEVITNQVHNTANSAGQRLRQAGNIVSADGQVNDVSATTTSFVTDLTQSINDFYSNHTIVFTSGNLEGQARVINSYNGTTKAITLDINEPLLAAPDNASDFTIFADHVHPISEIADAVWDEQLSGHQTAGSAGRKLDDNMTPDDYIENKNALD